MYDTDKEIVIIGAGPVGLALAKELGELGLHSTIYDSKSSVSEGSDKASGILSIGGLNELGISYDKYKNAVLNTLNGARIHAGKTVLNIEADNDKAYILDRKKFAELLAKYAKENGATLKLKTRLNKEELLKMQNNNTIIVGADGAVSTVAKTFNFPPIERFILTYKAEYKNVDVEDVKKVELFFSNNITKGFFGWIAPYSKSNIEIGIGVSSDSKKNSFSVFSDFINKKEIADKIEGAKLVKEAASIIPIEVRKKTAMRSIILVGDSAGQVKASTGGGIIFGISCAKIAASTIYRYIQGDIDSLSEYERLWRRNYLFDLKLHKFIHNYYSSSTTLLSTTMRILKVFGIEQFLAKYGNMDKPSLMFKFKNH